MKNARIEINAMLLPKNLQMTDQLTVIVAHKIFRGDNPLTTVKLAQKYDPEWGSTVIAGDTFPILLQDVS
jgi:hypothetical protein